MERRKVMGPGDDRGGEGKEQIWGSTDGSAGDKCERNAMF